MAVDTMKGPLKIKVSAPYRDGRDIRVTASPACYAEGLQYQEFIEDAQQAIEKAINFTDLITYFGYYSGRVSERREVTYTLKRGAVSFSS